MSEEDAYRALKRTHQQLLRDWKRKKGPCIVCAEREGSDRDHLPPEVLFPASIRNHKTEFFTFPVCGQCNQSSSDADFLFSVALSFGLNQDAILAYREPTDPDLLALYRQSQGHFVDPEEADHRIRLIRPLVGTDPHTGKQSLNLEMIPVSQTLTKMAKSIYWLHSGGDILQQHDPGWWIRPAIDTTKEHFIENLLKTSHSEIHWGDRFISRFTIGQPQNGVGGLIICSLHFYTQRVLGKGMSWLVIGSPAQTFVDGRSLYEWSISLWGKATIQPGAGDEPVM